MSGFKPSPIRVSREAIGEALKRLGIYGHPGEAIRSALAYIQIDPELSFFHSRTVTVLLDFIDDSAMVGKWDIDAFDVMYKVKNYLCELGRYLAEIDGNEGRIQKLDSGVHGLACACGEF